MLYHHTVTGTFISRPNRFIAHVLVDGRDTVCHVKNTGRLRELLIPGVPVILEFHPDAQVQGRKTSYSLIGVYKKSAGSPPADRLINIDSQAPNQAAASWLTGQENISGVRREVFFQSSRFDLAFFYKEQAVFMEVKGVTLENDGIACFPDAPTERGVKHVMELIKAREAGYLACLLFVIQMDGIKGFSPNRITHPEFADALKKAAGAGVSLLAYDCCVTAESLLIRNSIPVLL